MMKVLFIDASGFSIASMKPLTTSETWVNCTSRWPSPTMNRVATEFLANEVIIQ